MSGMASIAMFGNTNQPVEVMVRSSHLFVPMPDVIREDMAFLDRIHFYIPGWEIPKMRVEFFTDHYGFVVDYLAEALRELRKHNFTETIDRYFSLGNHLNARDVKAVRKTSSGLLKLVYPARRVHEGRIGRSRLHRHRRPSPGERATQENGFVRVSPDLVLVTSTTRVGKSGSSACPEQGGRDMISTDPLAPGSVYTASVDDQRQGWPVSDRGRLLAWHRKIEDRWRHRRADEGVDPASFRLHARAEGEDGHRPADSTRRISTSRPSTS